MHFEVDFSRLGPDSLSAPLFSGETSGSGIRARMEDHEGRWSRSAAQLAVVIGKVRLASSPEVEVAPETVLARYARSGADFLSGLHGTYAIAIIDAERRQVLLANDRMGVHGWCYVVSNGCLRFSDRADQLGNAHDIDPQAVFTYLLSHVIPSPDTIFRSVKRLPPGHRLVASDAGLDLGPHWKPVFEENRRPDFAALKDEFKGLVRSSVRREWDANAANTGTFLSGGTDSSTVSGMLREIAGVPIRAYSIGFDADGYDEMEYARLAARHFGVDHREYYLSPEDVREGIPKVATFYDQPFGNSSAVAGYHCARIARQDGLTRLLAGDGGDELFGGNTRYAKQRVFGLYDQVPSFIRRGLMEPLLTGNSLAGRLPLVSKAASYVQQARVPMPDRMNMYNLLLRLGPENVLTPAFRGMVDAEHAANQQRAVYQQTHGAHSVNRQMAYDWKFTLTDNDLPKVIGTTALAGMDVAFPLLSDDLIDFSMRLPVDYKLKGLKLRWFFKEALRGFLPDEILTKKKQGFGLPFGVWALRHAPLAAQADDAVASFALRGIVSEAFTHRLRKELLPAHPGYYGELVWIITMLEFWLRDRAPDYRLTR